MAWIISGVSFHRFPASPDSACPFHLHILGQQLMTSAGHSMGIEVEEFRELAIAVPP